MIKFPEAGASKTRLVPPLTPEEAANLSRCFLHDTIENIAGIVSRAVGVAVYTPVEAATQFSELLPEGFGLVAQRGESFGERLLHAAEDLLLAGYSSVCLIDSDSPTLPTALLTLAVESLSRPGDRVVLGPADDGGYYLIGLKRPHRSLFFDIEWSTPRVLGQTIERASALGLAVETLSTWYDVDDGMSLNRLCDELLAVDGAQASFATSVGYAAPHTRGYLARLIDAEGRGRIWPSAANNGRAA